MKWFNKNPKLIQNGIYYLGNCYLFGSDNEEDKAKCFSYYEEAAKLGHMDAQIMLVDCYKQGIGCKKDLNKAKFWQDIVDNNKYFVDLTEPYTLMDYEGEIDQEKIKRTIVKYAKLGYPKALYLYASLLNSQGDSHYFFDPAEDSYGDECDYQVMFEDSLKFAIDSEGMEIEDTNESKDLSKQIILLYELAYRSGYTPAAIKLGNIYQDKYQETYDIQKSIMWYECAISQGELVGAIKAAHLYTDGYHKPQFKVDKEKALKYYEYAACHLHLQSISFLVDYYLEKENLKEAFKWFEKGRFYHLNKNYTAMADRLYKGDGVKEDKEKAIQCYEYYAYYLSYTYEDSLVLAFYRLKSLKG